MVYLIVYTGLRSRHPELVREGPLPHRCPPAGHGVGCWACLACLGVPRKKGGSDADSGKQAEAGWRTQRVPGVSHSPWLHLAGVPEGPAACEEVVELEANLPWTCKVHVPDPNKLHCFQYNCHPRWGYQGGKSVWNWSPLMYATWCLPKWKCLPRTWTPTSQRRRGYVSVDWKNIRSIALAGPQEDTEGCCLGIKLFVDWSVEFDDPRTSQAVGQHLRITADFRHQAEDYTERCARREVRGLQGPGLCRRRLSPPEMRGSLSPVLGSPQSRWVVRVPWSRCPEEELFTTAHCSQRVPHKCSQNVCLGFYCLL